MGDKQTFWSKRRRSRAKSAVSTINCLVVNLKNQQQPDAPPIAANQLFSILTHALDNSEHKLENNLNSGFGCSYQHTALTINNYHIPLDASELKKLNSDNKNNLQHPKIEPETFIPKNIDCIIYVFALNSKNLQSFVAPIEMSGSQNKILMGITPMNTKTTLASDTDIAQLQERLKIKHYHKFDPWGQQGETLYGPILNKIIASTEEELAPAPEFIL